MKTVKQLFLDIGEQGNIELSICKFKVVKEQKHKVNLEFVEFNVNGVNQEFDKGNILKIDKDELRKVQIYLGHWLTITCVIYIIDDEMSIENAVKIQKQEIKDWYSITKDTYKTIEKTILEQC